LGARREKRKKISDKEDNSQKEAVKGWRDGFSLSLKHMFQLGE
jgi:hypothetical protein